MNAYSNSIVIIEDVTKIIWLLLTKIFTQEIKNMFYKVGAPYHRVEAPYHRAKAAYDTLKALYHTK